MTWSTARDTSPRPQVWDNMENIHTGDAHTPNPNVYGTHNDGGPLRKTPKSFRSHTAKHVGPLPRPLTESCCMLSGLCTHIRDNDIETTHTGLHTHPSQMYTMMTSSNGNIIRVTGPLCGEFTGHSEFPTQRPVTRSFDVFFDLHLNNRLSKQPWGWWFQMPSWSLWRQCNDDTHNDGGPLGKTPKSFRSHTAKHVGPLPRPLTESCCTLSGLCTHVRDNNMENTHTGASHAHTPNVYDTHNDGGPLGKIPESVGPSVCSHTVKHVGPLPRPCGPELSKSWPHLDHRQASAHRSSAHHRPQCVTMLPRRSSRDCNNYPGFRLHVGDVNQAQCQRVYSRHKSWVWMAADDLRMHLLLC